MGGGVPAVTAEAGWGGLSPRPDQRTYPPGAVITPGGAAGTFRGRLVVVYGVGYSGVFVYSPSPAEGNLIVSIAAKAGTDPYGNAYPQGLKVTTGVISGTTISASTFEGTDFSIGTDGAFFYTT